MNCADDLSSNHLLYLLYDRLGNEVFSMSNYDGSWNGLDNNGDELPEKWLYVGIHRK
ncbi:MAG: gliding motility-associated C-terminal domain-containing protein [Saprospiraceae bacterium]